MRLDPTSPLDRLVALETLNALDAALDTLDAGERVLLELRYGLRGRDAHAWQSVADALDLSVSACKVWHGRALGRLRDRLSENP